MAADFQSKHGIVKHSQAELFMGFTDMRTLLSMLPEDKRQGVEADYDSVRATVQGFTIGVRVTSRIPYSLIELQDDGAPFKFKISLHFDPVPASSDTEVYIEIEAGLNLLMRKMLGGKIQEALDKVIDGLAQ